LLLIIGNFLYTTSSAMLADDQTSAFTQSRIDTNLAGMIPAFNCCSPGSSPFFTNDRPKSIKIFAAARGLTPDPYTQALGYKGDNVSYCSCLFSFLVVKLFCK